MINTSNGFIFFPDNYNILIEEISYDREFNNRWILTDPSITPSTTSPPIIPDKCSIACGQNNFYVYQNMPNLINTDHHKFNLSLISKTSNGFSFINVGNCFNLVITNNSEIIIGTSLGFSISQTSLVV